jgi:hypothetical protein
LPGGKLGWLGEKEWTATEKGEKRDSKEKEGYVKSSMF